MFTRSGFEVVMMRKASFAFVLKAWQEERPMQFVCPGSRDRLSRHTAAANGKAQSRQSRLNSLRSGIIHFPVQSERLEGSRYRFDV